MAISRRKFLASAAAIPILLSLPGRAYAATKIHILEGRVYINDHRANIGTSVQAGDKIEVLQGGKIALSIGGDAFLLRAGTTLEIEGDNGLLVTGLRLVTGGLLAVFDRRYQPMQIDAKVATIGIRGTAVYLNLEPHTLYGCTCYGDTEVQIEGSDEVERISAIYHHPYEIAPGSEGNMAMQMMPIKDHTDDELRMLEGFVGRKPGFDK